jgi:hypothetical protein
MFFTKYQSYKKNIFCNTRRHRFVIITSLSTFVYVCVYSAQLGRYLWVGGRAGQIKFQGDLRPQGIDSTLFFVAKISHILYYMRLEIFYYILSSVPLNYVIFSHRSDIFPFQAFSSNMGCLADDLLRFSLRPVYAIFPFR